jgi:hypothetical protein
MSVTRLRSRRDTYQEGGIAHLRDTVLDAADKVPGNVLDRIVHLLDRELSSRRGWRFLMVEQSWLGEFGQGDRWSFCLTAARMAAGRERR